MVGKLHKNPRIAKKFPALTHLNHRVTSPQDLRYNCVAWALGDPSRWWWPDSMGVHYWPPGVPREETVPAFEGALAQLGFHPCATRTPEKDVEKVALFALQDKPTHVAKLVLNKDGAANSGRLRILSIRLTHYTGRRMAS